MFSEVTEVRDAIHLLTPARRHQGSGRARWCGRCAGMTTIWPRARSTAAPTPRPATRRAGFPTSSKNRWARSPSPAPAPSMPCCRRAKRCASRGLVFAATPASDFVCGTLQLASGMNLHVFTTGRGTPYGLAAVPVIKVSTRSELAQALERSDRPGCRPHRHRRKDHRAGGLGAVPADAGRGQRPQAGLGRPLGPAQRSDAV